MADAPRLDVATVRRLILTITVWVAGIAASHAVAATGVVPWPWSYNLLLVAVLIDACLLHGFFAARARLARLPDALTRREAA